jgi:LuxR family maltose regulon positive regulatory protein
LFRLLQLPARVTTLSAPAGSGKTVLLRSWIGEQGLEDRTAWVSVASRERDPHRFWLSVLGALRNTVPGSALGQELTASPDPDGWTMVERLLRDLARLQHRVWLVIDDVHELESAEALRQLELLVLRAPHTLQFVLATRYDLGLGLHRLRLEGELAEIRADDLRFTVTEARDLFQAAGVELPEAALAQLYQRTEGWVAGLRLAALSLAANPDPERFASEYSGSERTVAEYLLAEVLERQSEVVRVLLLRTSMLERVSGELADALTGGSDGERVLQDLETANAFVVALDAGRTWFRYHPLFADLLRLELRRTASGEVIALHHTAANWFADHGHPVEAIRHAQAAGDWGMAVRVLADHWLGLHLGGQVATVHAILAGLPADAHGGAAELAALAAADELAQGSLAAAQWYLQLATRESASVPVARRARVRLLLGVVGLLVARQRGDLPAVAEAADRLQALASDAAPCGLDQELRALALVSLGTAEYWAARFDEAGSHLDQGVTLARQIGRPFLELTGLAHQAGIETLGSYARAIERAERAVELARRHGWSDEPVAGAAYQMLAGVLAWRGRSDEAESWLQRAERTLRMDAEPAIGAGVHYIRGLLKLTNGREHEAVTSFRAADRMARRLATPHLLLPQARALLLQALVRMGQTELADRALASMGDQDAEPGEIRVAVAALRLARHDPGAAAIALAPVLDGSVSVDRQTWLVQAFMLAAAACDVLGDLGAAQRAVGRALDLARPDRTLAAFLIYPAPGLLERHARDCIKHTLMIAEILSLLPAEPGGPGRNGAKGQSPAPEGPGRVAARGLTGPLTRSEARVLRFLTTNLTAPEIARELSVSVSTVRTHMRNLYAKLGAHHRTEATARAYALGLLAPSPGTPCG